METRASSPLPVQQEFLVIFRFHEIMVGFKGSEEVFDKSIYLYYTRYKMQ